MKYKDFQIQLPKQFNNWETPFCKPKIDIFQAISAKINSMISPNLMQLLNLAVSCLQEDEVYCDIGTFQGASLISALLNHPDKTAYAVDNFSELDPENKNFDTLANNLEEFNLSEQVFFCYQDFEEFFRDLKNEEIDQKIGIYFYDASQNYRSCLLGLLSLKPVISNQALIIITNCQWQSCQQAVRDFLFTHHQARLIIDFSQADYLLWNGIQILSWDNQLEHSPIEDDLVLNSELQQAINNIAKSEINHFCEVQQAEALSLSRQGKYSQAERIYFNLLHYNKSNSLTWQNLGILYYQQEKYFPALECLTNALAIYENQANYHYTIGLILEKIEINKAIEAYQKAIELNPQLVDAYNNLGNIFLSHNHIATAEDIFRKAIIANPEHFGGYINLGNLLIQNQQIDEAILCYQKALNLKPNDPNIFNNLSLAYKLKNDQSQALFYHGFSAYTQGEYEEAIKFYKQAIKIDHNNQNLYFHLAWALHSVGKTKEAITELKIALQLLPNNLLMQITNLQILPVIYQDIEEINFYRESFQKKLATLSQTLSLETEIEQVNALDAISRRTNFYLAYQCKNDIDLQKQYGKIVHKIMIANYPEWSKSLPIERIKTGEKISIGYLSSHLYSHNGANWALGWIKNCNYEEFEIYCYHIGLKTDRITEEFKLSSDTFVHLPVQNNQSFMDICQKIIADKLDILVFPAIGMEAMDGLFAGLRLAPIQCTAWGHPVTSGLPTVDYYLSSELMEIKNAEEHYSEKLIRLPNLGFSYIKPIFPELNKSRGDFALAEDSIVYLCCQSIFKYLPQYDYIFPTIAQTIHNAKFVFISASEGKYITYQFQQRLHQAFAKFGLNSEDYCVMLPRQNPPDFLQLMMISDIFLDTFEWNGGNTTLQAIAGNLPIVTCPGEFMRGRHSYAFLKMLGVTDTIANSEAEYIEIAVKLALNTEWKNNIIERMKSKHESLYEDLTCVRALEEFYKSVVYTTI